MVAHVLVGAVLGRATCVVGSRATTTGLSSLVAHRRFREVLAALAIVPFILIGPLMSGVTGLHLTRHTVDRAAEVLGWTPVGAAWALPETARPPPDTPQCTAGIPYTRPIES